MKPLERLAIKRKIVEYILKFDDKEIFEKVPAVYDLEDVVVRQLIDEVWNELNKAFNPKYYCTCKRPDRESGHAHCNRCKSDVRWEVIDVANDLQDKIFSRHKFATILYVNNKESDVFYKMLDFEPKNTSFGKEIPMDEKILGTIYNMSVFLADVPDNLIKDDTNFEIQIC